MGAMLDINQSDHISTPKIETVHISANIISNRHISTNSLLPNPGPLSTSSLNGLNLSPSVSPRIYTNPMDYIDYDKTTFDTWFSREKHRYIIAVQECAASHSIGLPEFIAEMIVLDTILLPGCYTLTGLLFPSARNLNDLFAEYANAENGYISNKTDKGIAYKRKKPMINQRRPENNTASLWMDEDGSICGFRCIWVRGNRGKLMVDQKFCVLNGCWTLTGELTITFETWDMEDEFEGYLEADTFHGRWTTGKELFGEFQWFVTTVESFYLKHNIPHEDMISVQLDDDGNALYTATSIGFHDSMASEDEFDLEDEPMSPALRNVHHEMVNVLQDKCFDIEINESLTICAKFLKENSMLEISEKTDLEMDFDVANMSTTTDSYDEENEVIGYGKWIRNGKMNFSDVKYMEQKLLLSFDGCCDGKKVLGRLRIYHDNGTHSASPKPKRQSSLGRHLMENDLDDDDELFGIGSVLMDDGLRDSEEEEQDDEERISFIQMIIVSNVYDS